MLPILLKMAIIVLVPVLLLLDTGIAVVRGGQFGRLDLAVVTADASILLSFLLVAASQSGRLFLQKHREIIVYVFYSSLGAWLAAEAIVACFGWFYVGENPFTPPPPSHTRPAGVNFVFRPDELTFPGVEGISHYTTNSKGIRGPEFPSRDSAYRILTIGGSTTECAYLDDKETWQHLVMGRLNQDEQRGKVWVGSVGISGFQTVNHLKFVEESSLMEEVDALIFLIGANDFSQFVRGRLRDGEFLKDYNIISMWRHSPILRLVRTRWDRRLSGIQAEDITGGNYQLRRMGRQKSRIRDTLPNFDRALQQYEARIQALVQLTRGYGLRPILVTQPTLWDENLSERGRALLWLGDITGDEYLSVEAGRAGINRHNEVVMSVCKRMGVECINTESMNGQERYFYDDFHFNEAGAAELARLVAGYLLNHSDSSRGGTASLRTTANPLTSGNR